MRKTLISFNGKFLECDSLLELKASANEDDWFTVCDSTVKAYCYLRVAKDLGPAKISKQDLRLFKRLGQTIDMLKKVDPLNMGDLDLDKVSKAHVALIEQEWKDTQKEVSIAHNQALPNADITVSDL